MKKQESKGIMHIYEIECPKCDEWFRTESEMNEPPRNAYCRHCDINLWDESFALGDGEMVYEEYRHIGHIVIDLFTCEVVEKHLKS